MTTPVIFTAAGYTWRATDSRKFSDRPNDFTAAVIEPIDASGEPLRSVTIGRCTREAVHGTIAYDVRALRIYHDAPDAAPRVTIDDYSNPWIPRLTDRARETLADAVKSAPEIAPLLAPLGHGERVAALTQSASRSLASGIRTAWHRDIWREVYPLNGSEVDLSDAERAEVKKAALSAARAALDAIEADPRAL